MRPCVSSRSASASIEGMCALFASVVYVCMCVCVCVCVCVCTLLSAVCLLSPPQRVCCHHRSVTGCMCGCVCAYVYTSLSASDV